MAQLFSYNGRWVTLEEIQKSRETDGATDPVVKEVEKRFCDQCDSKGVRHKKVCPLYK
jgi:hypothetical protein